MTFRQVLDQNYILGTKTKRNKMEDYFPDSVKIGGLKLQLNIFFKGFLWSIDKLNNFETVVLLTNKRYFFIILLSIYFFKRYLIFTNQ